MISTKDPFPLEHTYSNRHPVISHTQKKKNISKIHFEYSCLTINATEHYLSKDKRHVVSYYIVVEYADPYNGTLWDSSSHTVADVGEFRKVVFFSFTVTEKG